MQREFGRSLFLGVTMASSWAWGSSLMVGMTTSQQKGLVPFLLWAIANAAAIPFCGFLVDKLDNLRKQAEHPILRVFMSIMQMFVVWVNLQEIYMVSMMTGLFTSLWARVFAMAIGAAFILLVMRHGLKRSMVTDQFQWYTLYAGLVVMLVYSAFHHAATRPLHLGMEQVSWGLYAAISLLCGPMLEMQQWQRARIAFAEGRKDSFLIAGAAFAIYLTGVFALSRFYLTHDMTLILLFVGVVLAIGSTVSGGAALHEIAGENVGLFLGLLAVFTWPLVYQLGIIAIWNIYGTARIFIVLGMVALALWAKRAEADARA